MPIIAGVAVLGLILYLMVTQPKLRVAGAIVLAATLGGVTWWVQTTDDLYSQVERSFPPEELTLSDVVFEAGPRVSTLSGRVLHTGESRTVREIDLNVRLFDCSDEAQPVEACVQIGADDGVARLDLPPGQLRSFSATLRFSDLPQANGTLRWDYEIATVRARPE